jgi:hypothetical protein
MVECVKGNSYREGMARPPFSADKHQRRLLEELMRNAKQRADEDARLTALLAEAHELAIPIAVMAAAAEVERKTVYRRLGHPME